jgi:MFS transporter, CP family, cyanate transporter
VADRQTEAARGPHPAFADETLIDAEANSVPPPAPHAPTSRTARLLLAATLVLIGFCLRPLYTSLGAVLPDVIAATGLGAGQASLLTTLPVLCLGLFGPLAPILSRRFGTERTVLAFLVILGLGTALRGAGAVPALTLGTLVAGIAIANLNVALPGLIKRDFSDCAGLMSGFYVMALCGGAALAAGLTVPIQRAAGGSWATALGFWALPCLAAIPLWAAQVPRGACRARATTLRVRGIWRSPLAWMVTAFMAFQSMFSFSVFGWLSPILQSRGIGAAEAGAIVSGSVLCQTVACLVAPPFAASRPDQRLINVVVTLTALAGFLGCIFAPLPTVWGWAILQGVGQGALTSVALTLIVLRAADAHVAAELSSMVQSLGYGIGATGPLLVGLIQSRTGGFEAVGAFFLATGVCCAIAGFLAGQPRLVAARLVLNQM